MRYMNRRRFLSALSRSSLATALIVAAGQVLRFLSYQPAGAPPTVFSVGRPEDYPPDELVYVDVARAYVGRDAQGLYALDAVCTHLGCLVEKSNKRGFVCPCHESRFDAAGRVVAGPATQPLRPLHLRYDGEQGLLFVDRSETVAPAARLAV